MSAIGSKADKPDALAKAEAALHHFIACLKMLPSEQAETFLSEVRRS
jgi:hypothetical protein